MRWRFTSLGFTPAAGIGLLLFGMAATAREPMVESVLLRNGGKVIGKVVESPAESEGESPNAVSITARRRESVDIVTKDAIRIRLASSEVVSRDARDTLSAYHAEAPRHEDTVDGHWKMSQWCKEHRLSEQRETHLQRIIELDPNHQGARRLLGHTFRDGQWTTINQWRQNDGLVLYKGKWRYPQDAELLRQRELSESQYRLWISKLTGLLREWDKTQSESVKAEIENSSPVESLAAVVELNRQASSCMHRRMLQRTMMNLSAKEDVRAAAVRALAAATLRETDGETLFDAIDHLRTHPPELFDKLLLDGLRSKENRIVNRSAALMARFRRRQFIDPMVEALTTTHSVIVPTFWLRANYPNHPSLVRSGRKEFVDAEIPFQNQEVLNALIEMTEQNFAFNADSWRLWHAQEKIRLAEKEKTPDLRRESL
jgi:hypothetical protein